MNANNDIDRRLSDLYAAEGSVRAPDEVLRSALSTIETTRQRRPVFRVPWRLPTMTAYAKVAIAAVVVIALGALGLAVLRSPGPNVGAPLPTPSPSVTPSPTAKPLPTPTPLPTAAALNKRFRSPLMKIEVGYPGLWTVKPATVASTGVEGNFGDPNIDTIYEPNLQDHLFLALRSSPLGSQTAEEWLAAQAVVTECPSTTPTTVDGNAGTIGNECDVALAVKGDRGYVIHLYTSGDEPWVDQVYNRAWFLKVLATVKLDPAAS